MANLTTLSSGSSVVLTVTEQQSIVLNNGRTDVARLQITTGPGAGQVVTASHNGRRVYGPFGAGTITLSAVSGDVRYELSGDSSALDDDTQPLTPAECQTFRAANDAGMLAVPAGTRIGTIASVPTASILLDAGSGGTVTTARVTFAPPTDTIGAQRLLTPTAETYTLTMDSALDVTLGDLNGIALVMHAIGVSTDAVLTGESYVAESDYTLAEYIAGDARFEWLDSTPTRVRLTLQRGSSTRYATLSVVAEVSA